MDGARWSFDPPHACHPPPSKAPLMRRTSKLFSSLRGLGRTRQRLGVRCDSTAFPSVHFRRRWSPRDSRGARHRQECLYRRPRLTESVGVGNHAAHRPDAGEMEECAVGFDVRRHGEQSRVTHLS